MNKIGYRRQTGFTIVELLVVIVVIGILAAITIVSFTGISGRAKIASLQSDLTNASNQIKLYQVTDNSGYYPVAIDCTATPASNTICLKASPYNSYTYSANNSANPKTFKLDIINGTTKYRITNDSSPVAVVPPTCPTGYIVVPGSNTYGTDDFCVMKYEAKNVGGVATSQAALVPWNNISQNSAITASTAACSGCHLVTEAEWMTIVQNVVSVSSNWSGGAVGSGYVYCGHHDASPNNSLDADTNDSNGYYGTGNTTPSNQRRTFNLSNGEVIWDLAGNLWEWTSGTVTTGQPGVTGGGYGWREWTAVTNPGTVSPNPSPTATGISGSSTWNSSKGIGEVYSNADETASRAFFRGGNWDSGDTLGGVFAVGLDHDSSFVHPNFGFRVAK